MIRFISFLLGRPYENCKGCEILKQQLQFVNEEKRELTSTLISIIKPAPPVLSGPINDPIQLTIASTFSRRRAALEERDRLAAKTVRESTNLGKPDDALTHDIDKLEEDLGIKEEVN